MSIIIKHIWRNIKSNRFRSILVIFSLALAAAVFYLNLNIQQDANESTLIILQGACKDYDLSVTGDCSDDSLQLPACKKTLDMEVTPGKIGGHPVYLYTGDVERMVEEGLMVLDDTVPSYSLRTEGQAIMPRSKALFYGIALGDRFSVTTATGAEEYTLVAYTESSGMFSADNATTGEVFTYKSDYRANLLCLALEDDSAIDDSCSRLQGENPDFSVRTLYDSNATSGRIESIRQLLSIILLLVIAITFFVVSSTNSLIINYRIPVLGTFRSIGAAAWETNFLLIMENFVYGLVASIPGVFFGELIRVFLRTQFLGVSHGAIHLSYVLMIPAFSIAMNVVISLFAILRIGKTPIKDLIFRKQSSATKPSAFWGCLGLLLLAGSFGVAYFNKSYSFVLLIAELVLAVAGTGLSIGLLCSFFSKLFSRFARNTMGGPVWLGVRNLSVNRINRSTALLVSVVIALVMMVYICVSSIGSFFASYENNYPYDILIKFTEGPEKQYKYIEELDGVDSVVYEYWNIGDAKINNETMHVECVASDGYSNGIEVEQSLIDCLQNGEVIIDYLFADMNGFKIGDTIKIRPNLNSGMSLSAKIIGFCESGIFNSSRSTIMMTRDDFFTFVEVEPAIIGISTTRDIYDMISDINDATASHDGKLYSVTAKKDYVNSEISEAMSAVKSVSVVPVLTILLALCGLVNNQLISFNQKRMTFAVLYSTAMSRSQIKKMILAELVSSFVIGCATGLALSMWLTKIMRDIIFVSLAYVPMVVTAQQIALSLFLLLLLMIATSVFPLARLKKMDIVKEIKYE